MAAGTADIPATRIPRAITRRSAVASGAPIASASGPARTTQIVQIHADDIHAIVVTVGAIRSMFSVVLTSATLTPISLIDITMLNTTSATAKIPNSVGAIILASTTVVTIPTNRTTMVFATLQIAALRALVRTSATRTSRPDSTKRASRLDRTAELSTVTSSTIVPPPPPPPGLMRSPYDPGDCKGLRTVA